MAGWLLPRYSSLKQLLGVDPGWEFSKSLSSASLWIMHSTFDSFFFSHLTVVNSQKKPLCVEISNSPVDLTHCSHILPSTKYWDSDSIAPSSLPLNKNSLSFSPLFHLRRHLDCLYYLYSCHYSHAGHLSNLRSRLSTVLFGTLTKNALNGPFMVIWAFAGMHLQSLHPCPKPIPHFRYLL